VARKENNMTGAFFDLRIWQKAQKLAEEIYKTTKLFPKEELFGLTNQLRRSTVSVAANIAESQGRYYYKDKIRVLYISRGEIYEIQSHLRIALSQKYLSNKKFKFLDKNYDGLAKGINCLISNLSNKI